MNTGQPPDFHRRSPLAESGQRATSAPPAEMLGHARLGLALAGLLTAGIDVRTRDLGLGGPASNPLEVLMLFVVLVLLADTVMRNYQPWSLLRAAWKGNRWLTCYFLWAMVAGTAGILQFAKTAFVFRNLMPAFVVFVLLVHSMRSVREMKLACSVFLVAALPNLILGLVQRIRGGPFPVKLNEASAVKMDFDGSFVLAPVSGLFTHPNALSIFLLPVLLVGVGVFFSRVRVHPAQRLAIGLMLVGTILLLYFTRAKGAWAWGLFGIAILCLPKRFVSWRGAWLAQILFVAALVVVATLISLKLGGSLQTMQTRVQLWNSTLQAAQSSLFMAILGSGQELVWNTSARLADLQYANAHNVFLTQVVYFGFPGAAFYLLAFVLAIRQSQEAIRLSSDGEAQRIAQIANATLLAMAGHYFFEPAAESSGLAAACYFFMALAAVALRRAQRP